MIGFFPELFPDELLYSGCARYRSALGIVERHRAQEALFGDSRGTSVVELPGRLATLVSRLPPGAPYSVERLLAEHTMLPYYRPFKRADQVERATRELACGDASAVRMLLLGGSRVTRPPFLHYCMECVAADRQRYGVAYWHRVHQLPGVLCCPEHRTLVRPSGIRRTDRNSETRYFALEETLASGDAEPRDLGPREGAASRAVRAAPSGDVTHRLAQDAAWLLAADCPGPGVAALPACYHAALAVRGLTRGTYVRIAALRESVFVHYGAEFLDALGCPTAGSDDREDWVSTAVRPFKATLHPLHHLLLMQALRVTPRELLATTSESLRNSESAASRPSEGQSRPKQPSPKSPSLSAKVVAIPVRPVQHQNRKLGVTTAEWDKKLITLVNDHDVTQAAAAEALDVDANTLKRHAKRLGVWRLGWRLTYRHFPGRRMMQKVAARRAAARATYNRLRREYPHEGRTALEARAIHDVRWLRRYDKAWLAARQPPVRRAAVPDSRTDWMARDVTFSAEVAAAARRLRASPRPRRMTVTGVLREMGRMDLFAELGRLPKTRARLEQAAESAEAYANRKLERAAARYRVEGVVPKPSALLSRARLGKADWERLTERARALAAELAGVAPTVLAARAGRLT